MLSWGIASSLRCRRLVSCLTAIALLGGMVSESAAVVLYNVNFEAPTHVLNQLPTVGFGALPRNTPTDVVFGQPRIRSQAGILDGQFCRFESAYVAGYCQLEFGLDSQYGHIRQQYPLYRMRMDMLVERMNAAGDVLTVFADAPHAHSLKFLYENNMRVVVLGDDAYQQTIGTFDEGSRFSIRLDCDLSTEWWRIYRDGVLIFSGAFPQYYGRMMGLRYSLASSPGSNTACVDIDNVKIEGLPEPATLGLAVLGSLMALRRRRPRPVVSD